MAASKRTKLSSSSSSSSSLRHESPPREQAKEEEEAEEEEEEEEEEEALIPGLPDHLAQPCLAPLPAPLLYCVCRSWRRLLYDPSFPPFLALYALLYSDHQPNAVGFASFDPISSAWLSLPAPPLPDADPSGVFLLRHPSFLSRRLPLQSVAAGGHLAVLAGSTPQLLPALPRPLLFRPHPGPPRWILGPPPPVAPRRWCAAGAAPGGALFLASGVGPRPHDPALARSAALWHPRSGTAGAGEWEALPPLRDGRFSRDAAEAVGARGKLCMVNLRGRGPKQGAVLDLRRRAWEDMPPGMLAGWSGPAAAGDADDATIYVVDEGAGALRAYDWGGDRWETVAEAPELLRGAAQAAAGGGKVCVVTGCGGAVVVVDAAASPSAAAPRMWVVEPPPGKRVLAVHVLPRMSRPES